MHSPRDTSTVCAHSRSARDLLVNAHLSKQLVRHLPVIGSMLAHPAHPSKRTPGQAAACCLGQLQQQYSSQDHPGACRTTSSHSPRLRPCLMARHWLAPALRAGRADPQQRPPLLSCPQRQQQQALPHNWVLSAAPRELQCRLAQLCQHA